MRLPLLALALTITGLVDDAASQVFDNVWAKFARSPDSISAGVLSDEDHETDIDWGDLDQNGWMDVVIVRKQPKTTPGKRTNVLLMNHAGVLTDMTASFAGSSSDVPGDLGFLTPTNDRDVVITDVDGDSWLDVVTAVALSDGDPKSIGHPRVYMNLGNDPAGNWLGLDFQDARIPQLVQFDTGLMQNPRFTAVDAGDVTGDGFNDLYFCDHDSGCCDVQPAGVDMNDRLLINHAGFFQDESQLRMSANMLLSSFGVATAIDDMNGDGRMDVIKNSAGAHPYHVSISYNNLLGVGVDGVFNSLDTDGNGSGSPYYIDTGDLNADGRPDIITSDDSQDRYRINTGNDALDRAEFSGGDGGHPYEYVQEGDTGFGSNNLIVDINGDGWGDAIHADFDVDSPHMNRMHIFHNAGPQEGTPVGGIPTLREEFGSVGGPWMGVKGMHEWDLEGVHDFAATDFDNDGLLDLLISRQAGTDLWLQQPLTVQLDLGFGGPGSLALSVVGDDLTEADSVARYEVAGADPGAVVLAVFGLVNAPLPVQGGTLVPFPWTGLVPFVADANGFAVWMPRGSAGSPVSVFSQAIRDNGGTYEFSNAVEIVVGL